MLKGAEKSKKSYLKQSIPYILVVSVILISHFCLRGSNLEMFLAFIILIPIFAVMRFDGRIPVGYAILMLILSAVTLASGKEVLANQFAIYAYFLLVVGVACMLIEFLKEKK